MCFLVIQEISDLVTRQHFQIACQRYFEATHNVEVDGGIQHPNQYFLESQRVLKGEVKEKPSSSSTQKVQTIRATLPAKVEKAESLSQDVNMDSDDDYNYSTLDI